MWAAISFEVVGAALCVFLVATFATVATAFGSGPFAAGTPFVNATLLDIMFVVLAVSGLTLAASITEIRGLQRQREDLVRKEAMAGVSGRLIEAQEKERTRIARELHDDISQRIVLLSVKLGEVLHGSAVHEIQTEVDEIAASVQALSHELHSSKLEYLGLERACRSFCAEFSGRHKVGVNFNAHNVPANLPSEVSLCLFRVMQEALRNAAKHSSAKAVHVQLTGEPQAVLLVVADQGCGFDIESAKKSHGIGLLSMEERLKLIGGHLLIKSQPGRGTTVSAHSVYS
jgi:signal transduction histidine kinase